MTPGSCLATTTSNELRPYGLCYKLHYAVYGMHAFVYMYRKLIANSNVVLYMYMYVILIYLNSNIETCKSVYQCQ